MGNVTCETSDIEVEADVPGKVIYITVIMDVMESLSEQSVNQSVYMMDNNGLESTNQGTQQLKTVISPGDRLVWGVYGLEVETKISIKQVSGEIANACWLEEAGSPPFSYWRGIVKPDALGEFEYELTFEVESCELTLTTKPSLQVVANQGDEK